MILVTVGTTRFPALVREVDRLAGEGIFDENVLCQTGNSDVTLNHCEGFKFRPTLDDLYQQASLVITAGGSTIFTLISMRKRFIAFPNPVVADDHQRLLLERLSRLHPIFWSRDVSDLSSLYGSAMKSETQAFGEPSLADHLKDYLRL